MAKEGVGSSSKTARVHAEVLREAKQRRRAECRQALGELQKAQEAVESKGEADPPRNPGGTASGAGQQKGQ